MNSQIDPKNAAQKSAQNFFRKSVQVDPLAKQTYEERAVNAAKTARLRGLRLTKEAADKEEVDKLAVHTGDAVPLGRSKTVPAIRSAKMVRMSY
jgi:hypothetical protein